MTAQRLVREALSQVQPTGWIGDTYDLPTPGTGVVVWPYAERTIKLEDPHIPGLHLHARAWLSSLQGIDWKRQPHHATSYFNVALVADMNGQAHRLHVPGERLQHLTTDTIASGLAGLWFRTHYLPLFAGAGPLETPANVGISPFPAYIPDPRDRWGLRVLARPGADWPRLLYQQHRTNPLEDYWALFAGRHYSSDYLAACRWDDIEGFQELATWLDNDRALAWHAMELLPPLMPPPWQ